MKFTVLNGSPKTDKTSSTMTYIRYIREIFPEHSFEIINIGTKLNRLKMKDEKFAEIIDNLKNSNGIIWAFPVYTMLVPAQFKIFIEYIWDKDATDAFKNKYTFVLSTSLNFYDHTAHNYMRAITEDLGMKYVGYYSTQLNYLLEPEKRKNWYNFFVNFVHYIENNIPVINRYIPLKKSDFKYALDLNHPLTNSVDNSEKKITIVTDYTDPESNISKMIEQFTNYFSKKENIEIINLNDVDIKGGCLGCIKCGFDNECIYKDGFVQFFREKIMNKPIMIYAAETKDRYFSSKWKVYFDRMFHNGHTPSLRGTQIGYIISGPLSQMSNLRQLISAQVQCSDANLVDIITDEPENSEKINESLAILAVSVMRLSNLKYVSPATFLQVGGFKIFRDLVYGIGRIPFPSDYKFFKENKMFDFPTKDLKTQAVGAISSVLFKFKGIREQFQREIGKGMIMGPDKMLKNMDIEKEKQLMLD